MKVSINAGSPINPINSKQYLTSETEPSELERRVDSESRGILATFDPSLVNKNLKILTPIRRSKAESKEQLTQEFESGVFIRTFSDHHFEIKKVLKNKLKFEVKGDFEKLYWSSCSIIQKNNPLNVWEGNGDRCGLILSSHAQFGGWNMQDMGTDNPRKSWDIDKIVHYFPKNFPDIAFGKIIQQLNQNDKELARKILNLKDDAMIAPSKLEDAKNYLLSGLDKKDKERHQELLDRLPMEYKSVYSMQKAIDRMRALENKDGLPQNYNEAKIRYQPNDILGVFVFNHPDSIIKGRELQQYLASTGISVPFVTYQPRIGMISLYDEVDEIPEGSQELQSVLPPPNTDEYAALQMKYFQIAAQLPIDQDINIENIKKFLMESTEHQSTYEEYETEIDDRDFPHLLASIESMM